MSDSRDCRKFPCPFYGEYFKIEVKKHAVLVEKPADFSQIPVKSIAVLPADSADCDIGRCRIDNGGIGVDPRSQFLRVLFGDIAVIIFDLPGYIVADQLLSDPEKQSGTDQNDKYDDAHDS